MPLPKDSSENRPMPASKGLSEGKSMPCSEKASDIQSMPWSKDLTHKIWATNNPSVLGIDPDLTQLPAPFVERFRKETGKEPGDLENFVEGDFDLAASLIYEFGAGLIDAVAGEIPAVKLQAASYERYGAAGLKAMRDLGALAKEAGLCFIADAKRNDIGSTATAYGQAWFRYFGAGALTVNPYLGADGINAFKPFVEEGHGLFALVRTSNPSAVDLQDLILDDGRKVYESVADLVDRWGRDLGGEALSGAAPAGAAAASTKRSSADSLQTRVVSDPDELLYSPLGAVVGATWPEEATALRARMPYQIFLIPGFGAQGAGPKDAVAGFNRAQKIKCPDGKVRATGGLVNSSRGLMYAFRKSKYPQPDLHYKEACRDAVLEMKEALNAALEEG